MRNYITTHMLENDLDIMTWYEFKKLTFRPGEHPNLSKAEMWDQLKEHDVYEPLSSDTRAAKTNLVPTFPGSPSQRSIAISVRSAHWTPSGCSSMKRSTLDWPKDMPTVVEDVA